MGEPSSRTLVTLDVEQHQDPKPGYTANGHPLIQESSGYSLIQKRPVTYDTGGQEASASRPSLPSEDERERLRQRQRQRQEEIERKRIPQFEPQATISERVLEKGKQRSPPEETSVEEESSTKNSHVIAPKEFIEKEVAHRLPNDNAEVFLEHQDKKISSPSGNGHFHRHVQEDFTEKEDTGKDQNISTEDNLAKKEQSHSQTDDISTSVDQVVSENSSRKGDKPPQGVNIPSNKAHKKKDIFRRKMAVFLLVIAFILVLLNLPLFLFLFLFRFGFRFRFLSLNFGIWDCTSWPGKSTNFVDIPFFDVQSHILKINVGDLVAIRRIRGKFIYHHYAICTEKGYLMHRTKGMVDCFWLKKAKIKKETIGAVIKQGDHVRIENGTWEGKEPLPIEETIRRAVKNGEEGFNPFTNNCEHFARDCRYGEEVSREAEKLIGLLEYKCRTTSRKFLLGCITI